MKLTTILLLTASIIYSSWAYPGEFEQKYLLNYHTHTPKSESKEVTLSLQCKVYTKINLFRNIY